MRFKHFFWDFDGTLYDTYPRILRAFQKGLRDYGIDAPDAEVLSNVKKMLAVAAARYAAQKDGVTAEAIVAAYRAHAEEEDASTMRPYPGLERALDAAVRRGGTHYLYTHRGASALEAFRRDGLSGYFADFITREDGFPLKPAPDALLSMTAKHGLPLDACVMIGDRDIDLDAGKNAGMAGALFDPDGFYPDYPTPFRYRTMDDLRLGLIEKE